MILPRVMLGVVPLMHTDEEDPIGPLIPRVPLRNNLRGTGEETLGVT